MTKSKAYGAKAPADYDSGLPDDWPPDWPPPDEDDDPVPPDWPKPIPDDESYTLTLTAPATTYPCKDDNTVKAEVFNSVGDTPASALLNHGIRLTAVLYDTGEYVPVYMRKTGETEWSDRLLYRIVLLDDGINYGFEEDIEVWLDGTHDSLTVTFNAVIFTLEAGPSGSDTSGSLIGAPCDACPGDCSACCGSFAFQFNAPFEDTELYDRYHCSNPLDIGTDTWYKGPEDSCEWEMIKYCQTGEEGQWEQQSGGTTLKVKCIGNFWYVYSAADFDAPADDDIVARSPNTLDCPPVIPVLNFYNHKALGAVVNTGSLECADCDATICTACETPITATISGLGAGACYQAETCNAKNGVHVLGYSAPPICDWEVAVGGPVYYIHVTCIEGVWWAYGELVVAGICWAFKQENFPGACPPKTGWTFTSEEVPGSGQPPLCTEPDNPSFTLDY